MISRDSFMDHGFTRDDDGVVIVTDIHAYSPGLVFCFVSCNEFEKVDGFLDCRGGEFCREKYKNIFGHIGVNFGAGDGVTTFNVPNFNFNKPLSNEKLSSLVNGHGDCEILRIYHHFFIKI